MPHPDDELVSGVPAEDGERYHQLDPEPRMIHTRLHRHVLPRITAKVGNACDRRKTLEMRAQSPPATALPCRRFGATVSAGGLTGLSEDQLRAWLAEVRLVAALPDLEAVPAVDALVWGVWESRGEVGGEPALDDAEWDASLRQTQVEHVEEAMHRLREQLAQPATISAHGPDSLRRTADLLPPGDPVRESARQLADDAEVAMHDATLRRLSTEGLTNAAGLPRRMVQVEACRDGLRRLSALTDEREALAVAALRIAAGFRWAKRMAEAEVVEAGGNRAKAKRLRDEAAVLRSQDMARVGLAP